MPPPHARKPRHLLLPQLLSELPGRQEAVRFEAGFDRLYLYPPALETRRFVTRSGPWWKKAPQDGANILQPHALSPLGSVATKMTMASPHPRSQRSGDTLIPQFRARRPASLAKPGFSFSEDFVSDQKQPFITHARRPPLDGPKCWRPQAQTRDMGTGHWGVFPSPYSLRWPLQRPVFLPQQGPSTLSLRGPFSGLCILPHQGTLTLVIWGMFEIFFSSFHL